MWKLNTYVDSDWAGDKNDRRIVTGWCIFVNKSLISWGSRSQKNVTLSSSEAEYVGISEIVKEILFIRQILIFLQVKVEYPIMVNVDNVGAIYIAKKSDGKRTRHIDARYHFVREIIEDGIVKVIFVRTNDNKADIFTKNTNEETHSKHTMSYMHGIKCDLS